VHLVGPLYGDRKHAALRSAACFCLPSRQEGFSIAILEAMACRNPVVISDACHFPEVAEFGAGHVVALDPKELAAALRNVLEDPEARQRMGAAGFRLVQSRYTWPKIAERSVLAYQQVIARTPA
jgi:glycosyltransferase involved in cell wall biosynthesis